MRRNRAEDDREVMTTAAITSEIVASRVALGLQRKYGLIRYAITWVSRAVHSDPRAVKNWFAKVNAPRAAELIRLCVECDEVREEIYRLIDEGRAERAGGTPCSQSASRSAAAASDTPPA